MKYFVASLAFFTAGVFSTLLDYFVSMELLDKIMENDNEKSAEEIAQEYLAKHKILELFENLTANLVFERPGKYLLTALLWYILVYQNIFVSDYYEFIYSSESTSITFANACKVTV